MSECRGGEGGHPCSLWRDSPAADGEAGSEVPCSSCLAKIARPPCVVKADGLAAGKGVWVCHTEDALRDALGAAKSLGQPFHVAPLLAPQGFAGRMTVGCSGTSST